MRGILWRMKATPTPFVSLGMYAFTEAQQSAWRQLFDRFVDLCGSDAASVTLNFDHDPTQLLEPGLWFGHTCGYPLMTRLKESLSPFCVPLFDVPGVDGKFYCSRIIVAADSDIESISDSRGRVVAMNNFDSNSGMNVLRHAVADMAESGQFFSRVVTTGGHLHSLQAVASGTADIAAIDCVSYQLIEDWQPPLCAGLRIITDSVKTCGLPLVMSHSLIASTDTAALTGRLNQALEACDNSVKETLHLTGFEPVQMDDYQGILEVERYAVEHAYPELN
jgi:ABC-type phosphate/phosphonate transport system substrate-binding protein